MAVVLEFESFSRPDVESGVCSDGEGDFMVVDPFWHLPRLVGWRRKSIRDCCISGVARHAVASAVRDKVVSMFGWWLELAGGVSSVSSSDHGLFFSLSAAAVLLRVASLSFRTSLPHLREIAPTILGLLSVFLGRSGLVLILWDESGSAWTSLIWWLRSGLWCGRGNEWRRTRDMLVLKLLLHSVMDADSRSLEILATLATSQDLDDALSLVLAYWKL
ncbi:hypothetical protein Dimus_020712 [Dionaea muscipula]